GYQTTLSAFRGTSSEKVKNRCCRARALRSLLFCGLCNRVRARTKTEKHPFLGRALHIFQGRTNHVSSV
ncbi:hypothetical protein FHG87_023141, partial [Trinorchestia longiramus]